jgi:hypothetical protein
VAALRFWPEAWHGYAAYELSTGDAPGGGSRPGGDATDAADEAQGVPAEAAARAGDVYRRALLAVNTPTHPPTHPEEEGEKAEVQAAAQASRLNSNR